MNLKTSKQWINEQEEKSVDGEQKLWRIQEIMKETWKSGILVGDVI